MIPVLMPSFWEEAPEKVGEEPTNQSISGASV